jgi:hypothetical protein
MNPQPFLVIQPVPQWLYDDLDWLWDALDLIWHGKLADELGTRTPGPLFMREMQLAEIGRSGLADYLFQSDVAAVFRITGPALPPDIPRVIA